MSDLIGTRWGRMASMVVVSVLCWIEAGILLATGHWTWLPPAALAGVVWTWLVARQVGQYRSPGLTVVAAVAVQGGIAATGGWVALAHPHSPAVVVLVLPFAVAFIAAFKTLPPVCVVSPELRPWLTSDEIDEMAAREPRLRREVPL